MNQSHLYAFLCFVIYGVVGPVVERAQKEGMQNSSLLLWSGFAFVVSALIFSLYEVKATSDSESLFMYPAIIGVLYALGLSFSFKAFSSGDVVTVSFIIGGFPVMTAIVDLFRNPRDTCLPRLCLGACFYVLAVYLVNSSKITEPK